MNHRQEDWNPLPHDVHAQQIEELRSLLPTTHSHILDLGAGSGRCAIPLTEQGHTVLALDNDPKAIEQLRSHNINASQCDFLMPGWEAQLASASFDAILLVGNTFMLVHDTDKAIQLFQTLRTLLKPDGVLVLDAIPQLHWPELVDGNWQNGVSPDGSTQLLWAPDDNIFALRHDDDVNADEDRFLPGDRLGRLWTMGELRLLACATCLASPVCSPSRTLLHFRRS